MSTDELLMFLAKIDVVDAASERFHCSLTMPYACAAMGTTRIVSSGVVQGAQLSLAIAWPRFRALGVELTALLSMTARELGCLASAASLSAAQRVALLAATGKFNDEDSNEACPEDRAASAAVVQAARCSASSECTLAGSFGGLGSSSALRVASYRHVRGATECHHYHNDIGNRLDALPVLSTAAAVRVAQRLFSLDPLEVDRLSWATFHRMLRASEADVVQRQQGATWWNGCIAATRAAARVSKHFEPSLDQVLRVLDSGLVPALQRVLCRYTPDGGSHILRQHIAPFGETESQLNQRERALLGVLRHAGADAVSSSELMTALRHEPNLAMPFLPFFVAAAAVASFVLECTPRGHKRRSGSRRKTSASTPRIAVPAVPRPPELQSKSTARPSRR